MFKYSNRGYYRKSINRIPRRMKFKCMYESDFFHAFNGWKLLGRPYFTYTYVYKKT